MEVGWQMVESIWSEDLELYIDMGWLFYVRDESVADDRAWEIEPHQGEVAFAGDSWVTCLSAATGHFAAIHLEEIPATPTVKEVLSFRITVAGPVVIAALAGEWRDVPRLAPGTYDVYVRVEGREDIAARAPYETEEDIHGMERWSLTFVRSARDEQ